MELPSEIQFQGVLEQGQAFKAQLDCDNYPRFYFVLNIDPKTDTVLVLVSSTTDFGSHEVCKGGDDVHIVLSKNDYAEFTKDCLICCNRPIKIPKTKLEFYLKQQKYKLLQHLPQNVLDRLLHGVLKSPTVEANIKRMVLGSGDE